MRIAIASDHAGYQQKEALAQYLISQGNEVVNLGPDSEDRCNYPDYAHACACAIQNNEADKGVLVCGTGIGMSISANKHKGIRAAIIDRPDFAQLAREHNDLNVICVSGRFVPFETNCQILDAFVSTEFGGGRHAERVQLICDQEAGLAL